MTIYTVGHSTRPAAELLDLLHHHGLGALADIRAMPRSRRHPQFDKAALETSLSAQGVQYRHFPALGGRRTPQNDSVNTAWRDPAFRGYADYMQTLPFAEALDELVRFGAGQPTTVMCAEATWWTCHRRLLADALVARDVRVLHIASRAEPKSHALSDFARIDAGRLTYPGLL